MSFAPELDPTAGDPAGNEDAPAEVTAPVTPAYTPQERTFTQRELDEIVETRLARERRRASQPQTQTPADPYRAEISQLRQEFTNVQLDTAIERAVAKYTDFAPNHLAISKVIDDYGIAYAKTADGKPLAFDKMLEAGYNLWKQIERAKQPEVDIEAIKKQSFEEGRKAYMRDKTGKFASTPQVEGAGGGTPASTDPRTKLKTQKGALEASIERLTRNADQ